MSLLLLHGLYRKHNFYIVKNNDNYLGYIALNVNELPNKEQIKERYNANTKYLSLIKITFINELMNGQFIDIDDTQKTNPTGKIAFKFILNNNLKNTTTPIVDLMARELNSLIRALQNKPGDLCG